MPQNEKRRYYIINCNKTVTKRIFIKLLTKLTYDVDIDSDQ